MLGSQKLFSPENRAQISCYHNLTAAQKSAVNPIIAIKTMLVLV